MAYPNYLIHYNKNHSKKNGQFVSGDGDGDGTADEHHRYSKNGIKEESKGDWDYHKPGDRKYRKKLEKMGAQRKKYDSDFENSEDGKKARVKMESLLNEYKKLQIKSEKKPVYFDEETYEWRYKDKKFDEKIRQAARDSEAGEIEYFSKKGEYVCNKLLEKNSAYDVSSYGIGWDIPVKYKDSIDELIKNYGTQYYWSYNDNWDL